MATFYKISSSVGSGKTQAMTEFIRDNLGSGYLVVSPTIQLCTEIYRRVLLALAKHPEYANNGPVHLVVSEENKGSVYKRALKLCCDHEPDLPPIIIITTKTFEYLLDNLADHYKKQFSVFIDEGLPSIKQVAFAPGDTSVFLEHLDVDEAGRASALGVKKEILEWVAFKPKKLAGRKLDHLRIPAFAELAELTLSEHYDTYVWDTGRQIEAIAVLTPKPMEAFQSVTLVVANFERTLLPLLWQVRFGIEFEDFPLAVELYDAHKAKGPKMSIWYALHKGDFPSLANMKRNYESGEHNEKDQEQQVIFEAARQIDEKFPDGAYCWVANNEFVAIEGALQGKRMPANSSGLNEFQLFDSVVTLLCINLQPWVKKRLMKLFDLNADELYELWRFSHTYQAVGRCSLRLRDRDASIQVVVPSSFCADQLAGLFEGSVVKGQITKLPRYSAQTASQKAAEYGGITYTTADNTAFSKYRKKSKEAGVEPLIKEEWYATIRQKNLGN